MQEVHKTCLCLKSTGESASVHLCITALKSLSLRENGQNWGRGEYGA